MTAISVLFLLLILWSFREMFIGTITWVRRRKIRHDLRVEQTQRYFAEARNRLMDAAVRGEISVESQSFKKLYFINTFLMRRPDKYPQISTMLRDTLLKSDESIADNPLYMESMSWSAEVKKAAIGTAYAMSFVIINYSWILRTVISTGRVYISLKRVLFGRLSIRRLSKAFDSSFGVPDEREFASIRQGSHLVIKLENSQSKKDPIMLSIRTAQAELYKLSEADYTTKPTPTPELSMQ